MTQKNFFIIFLVIIICLFISTGCVDSSQSLNKKVSINNNVDDSPIEINDIEFVGLEITSPDSIGKRYLKTRVKNNSNLPISSLRIELSVGDKETTYIASNKIINPGKTSDYIKCFAPKSGKISDIEAKNMTIKVNKDGKMLFIDYDNKLDSYNVLEANVSLD